MHKDTNNNSNKMLLCIHCMHDGPYAPKMCIYNIWLWYWTIFGYRVTCSSSFSFFFSIVVIFFVYIQLCRSVVPFSFCSSFFFICSLVFTTHTHTHIILHREEKSSHTFVTYMFCVHHTHTVHSSYEIIFFKLTSISHSMYVTLVNAITKACIFFCTTTIQCWYMKGVSERVSEKARNRNERKGR